MIDARFKLHSIYKNLILYEKSKIDGFNDFNLLSSISYTNHIPLSSFDDFISFLYKNSGLELKKSIAFLKLKDIIFSEKQIFIFKKPGQIGATTFFTALFAYMFLKYKLPMMFVSIDSGKADIVQNQLASFLSSLGVKVLIKEPDFLLTNTGIVYFAYATSAKSFRSKPAAFIFIDEAAGMPINIGGEGDVITLSLARTTTFASIRKIFVFSTPTDDKSFLEKYYDKAEKYYVYKIRCEHCGFLTEPKVKDIVGGDMLICPNCKNEYNRISAIDNGEWISEDGDKNTDIIGLRINLISSPLSNTSDILYRYRLAENDIFALRSFLNLVMAEEYRVSENVFPKFTISTLQPCESEIILYSADPHYSDVHMLETAFRSDGYIYIKNGYVMKHGEFVEFVRKVPFVIIDVGYLSTADIESLDSDVKSKLIQVRGSYQRSIKGRYLMFARNKYAGVHFVFRQDTLMRLYRLASDDRIYINPSAVDVAKQIMTGLDKMSIGVDKKTGKYYWYVPDEFHEYTHFLDCLIYAVAIYEHYKNTNLIRVLTKSLKCDNIKDVSLKLRSVRVL